MSHENAGPDSGGGALVYAIGAVSYDFGTEARLDYFVEHLGSHSDALDPVQMAKFLEDEGRENADNANALIWTLNIDATPVYAIQPEDEFAVMTYLRLVRFFVDQEKNGAERISVAGTISGTTRLFNGTVVPTVSPVLRGMFNWAPEDQIQAILGGETGDGDGQADREAVADGVRNYLQRTYYELRNLGVAPKDRATNFAATNAFQLKEVFVDAHREDLHLDRIAVEPSPISRPDSDCWDVKFQFFDPTKLHERARKVYRYTVDISEVVPVTIGSLRSWYVY